MSAPVDVARRPRAELPAIRSYRGARFADWRTPAGLFAALDAEFAFTLDAAASSPLRAGLEILTPVDMGLWRAWAGRVYLNPPYGREIVPWLAKVAAEIQRREVELIVALIPARTDTGWFHDYVLPIAAELRFLRGRVLFDGPIADRPAFGSILAIYRNAG